MFNDVLVTQHFFAPAETVIDFPLPGTDGGYTKQDTGIVTEHIPSTVLNTGLDGMSVCSEYSILLTCQYGDDLSFRIAVQMSVLWCLTVASKN